MKIKCIKTSRMAGIKKGKEYEIIEINERDVKIKIPIRNEEAWFRGYYFDMENLIKWK